MKMRSRHIGIVAALIGVLSLGVAAPAGAVDIIAPQTNDQNAGWQAATCNVGTDATCAPNTPSQFFTQAAGHPGVGFTQFIVKNTTGVLGNQTPVGNVKTLLVDLPPGLSVNPQATPRCQLAAGASPSTCPANTQVGSSILTGAGIAEVIPGVPIGQSLELPPSAVYNLEPLNGQPARFGFSAAGNDVFLEPGVEWSGDYHEFFRINVPKLELPGLVQVRVLKNRLTFNGQVGKGPGGGGAFLTNPSTCFEPTAAPFQHIYSTFLHADSVEEPAAQFPNGAQVLESPLPAGVKPTGCANVPFKPSVASNPNTAVTDSPFGPTTSVNVPFDPNATIANSNLRTARISLPAGAGLNPAAADGLQFCNDAQFGKGTTRPVACPAKSEIGTVSIQTPVLPANSLNGKVFLGEQQGRNPASGTLYRIFIDAESARYGQSVRLVGNVVADPTTGQLTAVVTDAPQLPFTSVSLTFSGDKGVLTSPPTCGPNVTSGQLTPWSGTAPVAAADKGFALTKGPGGEACAKTMASRPFAPGFEAAPNSNKAKTFTPFSVTITRPQGQQELKAVNLTLPEGATAKLAGVPYCPPSDFNAAVNKSGAEEKNKPSCSDNSQVGIATVRAGTGAKPLQISGKAYLAGPYRGAPLSIVVITPAVAGPFDLGNVLVRVALNLDPETAQINPVAEIPDVFGGAKLSIRSIFVNVNRDQFTLNGTNCRPGAVAGTVSGGGADPANPAAFAPVPVSAAVKSDGCEGLKFRPKLKVRLFGKTKRAKHPKLRAELKARPDDANIARASVALPHAIFLDQANLGNVCTRVQYAADNCPKKSIYGRARAFTPLLGQPLEGPVYLRSSNNTLPDLVAHLEGQVDIDLVGRIDSFKGGIRTTFDRVPDVPVTKFVVTLPGGKHGLLVNSRSLCVKPVRGIVQLKGQNGKKVNKRPYLKTSCKKKYKKGKKHSGKKQGAKNGGKKN